jgi:DNA-binding MarR family transcriptional regulator
MPSISTEPSLPQAVTDGSPARGDAAAHLPPGGATVIAGTANLIEAARQMRWERFRFDLKLQDLLVLELLILLSFDAGRPSKYVRNPQAALARLIGMDESDFAKSVKRLKSYGFIALKADADGVEYIPDPDSTHWVNSLRLRKREELLAAISSVESSGLQLPLWRAEHIGEVVARTGQRNVLSESQNKTEAERPAIQPSIDRGISPEGDRKHPDPTSGGRGEIPHDSPIDQAARDGRSGEIPLAAHPFKSSEVSVESLKATQSFSSSQPSYEYSSKGRAGTSLTALTPEQRELRARVLAVLTEDERKNWGGRWTNLVKQWAGLVERALADYTEERKRADLGLREPIEKAGSFMWDFMRRVNPAVNQSPRQ